MCDGSTKIPDSDSWETISSFSLKQFWWKKQTQNIKEIAKIKQSLKMKRHSAAMRDKKYVALVILSTRYMIQIYHHPHHFCWWEGIEERINECQKWWNVLCFFTGLLRLWVTLDASALTFQFRSGVCLSIKNLQIFPSCCNLVHTSECSYSIKWN